MEHIRQSRPDSGLGLQGKLLKNFEIVSSSLGSGCSRENLAEAGERHFHTSLIVIVDTGS